MDKRVPRVVFAAGAGIDATAIQLYFAREGLAADFAYNPSEFAVQIASPDVFLIFLASDFGGGGARIIQEFKRRTKAVWMVLSKNTVARDKTKYFNLGASDFVKYPAPPAEFFTRAQNMLVRYLRAYSFDPAVELPHYLTPPKEGAVTVAQKPSTERPTETIAAPSPSNPTEVPVLAPSASVSTFTETAAAPPPPKATLRDGESALSLANSLTGNTPVENILRSVLREHPEEVVFLPERRAWRPETWPAASLPPKEHQHFKGVQNSIVRCRRLFEDTCKVLGADRIVLFSVEAKQEDRSFRCYVLVSSDPLSPTTNQEASADWFPQIFGAQLSRRGMFFNFAFDQSLTPKPMGWALNRNGEAASAVLNVLDERGAKAAILVEFSKLNEEAPLALLAEAESFLREPAAEYKNIDFLCRVYRQANLPVVM